MRLCFGVLLWAPMPIFKVDVTWVRHTEAQGHGVMVDDDLIVLKSCVFMQEPMPVVFDVVIC